MGKTVLTQSANHYFIIFYETLGHENDLGFYGFSVLLKSKSIIVINFHSEFHFLDY